MNDQQLISKDIAKYLQLHQDKELLRFTTVGSVDDGKSTLIGRLLYDTNAVFEDQLEAARKATKSDAGEVDLSLLTDGLKAEREQGITIDVAYRYFTTEKRKFIIADTPGHVQYTRNMATGASTADVAIILIDARLGVLAQSRRHATIASLLGIPKLLVAINKMDLKEYSQTVFNSIRAEFEKFAADLGFEEVAFFPISALKGDNIARGSENTPWFQGGSILNYLETTPLPRRQKQAQFYFPVQYVLRPNLNFRGYAGQIASGQVSVGDEVVVLPSGKTNKIASIVTYSGNLNEADAPLSVTLTLADEVDISRGDVLVPAKNHYHVSRTVTANVVWMSENPLETGRPYWIKHTTNLVTGSVSVVQSRLDIETQSKVPATELALNEIGEVTFKLNRPLVIDLYKNNRIAGAFIIIDRLTNATVGAGMVTGFGTDAQEDLRALATGVTGEERGKRFSQKPALVLVSGLPGAGKIILTRSVERALFDVGHLPMVLDLEISDADHLVADRLLIELLAQIKQFLKLGFLVFCPYQLVNSSRNKIIEFVKNELKLDVIQIEVEATVQTRQDRLVAQERNPALADQSYDKPPHADLVIDTTNLDLTKSTESLLDLLRQKKVVL